MRRTPTDEGLKLGGWACDHLAYADDVDLMGGSLQEIDEKTRQFKAAAGRVGLEINEDKRKVMKETRGAKVIDQLINCGGLRAEAVKELKYLGSMLTMENNV